jgi:DNA-dependent metalloprotease WSS1
MPQSKSGPSNHTGAQTARKRKAGVRIRGINAFVGQGKVLNEDVEEGSKATGTGFGKQAARCVSLISLFALWGDVW